tara:strand:- start:23 stop:241 length:219 start_codon:yes stop_codon:yes gene_type:complete
MKNSRLLIITIALFATLALYACVPYFDGGHGGGGRGAGKLSEKQSSTNIDVYDYEVYEYTVVRHQLMTSFNL